MKKVKLDENGFYKDSTPTLWLWHELTTKIPEEYMNIVDEWLDKHIHWVHEGVEEDFGLFMSPEDYKVYTERTTIKFLEDGVSIFRPYGVLKRSNAIVDYPYDNRNT